ncbi:MAG: hypothetical protein JWQ81_2260 [Amycolatopsis sp.]|uniref:HEAT repeat domain-containing protein n=1 Tax=Amycolatopsis sp. TaxID=37632 RepID=UPI002613E584|nr:HEAT repeat domain-containing protein [Amycolatopsis sp.]MCU1681521.1 hypothetical protein [Amycolatopsis sp.]
MDSDTLFAQAVASARAEDHETVWNLLPRIAESDREAARVAREHVTSPDPVLREVACDLLKVSSELNDVDENTATLLISLAANETDENVQGAIVRALGSTKDFRAVPVLIGFAAHSDADVRCSVAVVLPSVMGDVVDDAAIEALLGLSRDPDQHVRDWATFAVGQQTKADGEDVRAALWERTADTFADAREEGIRGLARRRERKVLPLLASLLEEESAHVLTFDAASYLADASLLPLLRKFDPTDRGVAEALVECDPAERDDFAVRTGDALRKLLPDKDISIFGARFEVGLTLAVGSTLWWSVEGLLKRAEGDPNLAARLAADDVSTSSRR